MDIKTKKFKILCCCAAGNGCCQLIMIKIKKVYKDLGLICTCEANTTSVGKAVAHKYDVTYCNVSLEKQFEEAKKKGAVVIPLKNIMSEEEIKEKTLAFLETLEK